MLKKIFLTLLLGLAPATTYPTNSWLQQKTEWLKKYAIPITIITATVGLIGSAICCDQNNELHQLTSPYKGYHEDHGNKPDFKFQALKISESFKKIDRKKSYNEQTISSAVQALDNDLLNINDWIIS